MRRLYAEEWFRKLSVPAQVVWRYVYDHGYESTLGVPGLIAEGPGQIAEDLGGDVSEVCEALMELHRTGALAHDPRRGLLSCPWFVRTAVRAALPSRATFAYWQLCWERIESCPVRNCHVSLLCSVVASECAWFDRARHGLMR